MHSDHLFRSGDKDLKALECMYQPKFICSAESVEKAVEPAEQSYVRAISRAVVGISPYLLSPSLIKGKRCLNPEPILGEG